MCSIMKSFLSVVSVLFVTVVYSSCSKHSDSGYMENISDSATLVNELAQAYGLGSVVADTYVGNIADGSYCILTIVSYEHSGDGLFSMQIMGNDGKLTSCQGERYTLRGDDDATIWSCESTQHGAHYYFQHTADNKVYHLTEETERTHDYPLQLINHKKLD